MNTWLPFIVVAAVVVLVCVIVVFAARWERKQEGRVDDVWRTFAAANGLRWNPTHGSWWNRRTGVATGTLEGAPFTLERVYIRTGKHRKTYTNMRTQLARPLAERVFIGRRRWLERLWTAFRGPIVETGASGFDERWIVRSRSRESALGLLRDDVRDALVAFPRCARMEARGGDLRLYWRNSERDPAVLTRGLDIVRAATR